MCRWHSTFVLSINSGIYFLALERELSGGLLVFRMTTTNTLVESSLEKARLNGKRQWWKLREENGELSNRVVEKIGDSQVSESRQYRSVEVMENVMIYEAPALIMNGEVQMLTVTTPQAVLCLKRFHHHLTNRAGFCNFFS